MSNVSSEMEPTPSASHVRMFTILVLSFTILVGVPGNALVLWITGVKMKRTMTTILFGNLALADITCCLLLPFSIVQYFYSQWLRSHDVCKILPFIIILNMYTSFFTLVAISVDRWILVVHPVWARNHRTIKMAWMMCLALWMLSFIICLPVVIYLGPNTRDNKTLCYFEPHMIKPYILTRAIFGFLIPLIIICTCYIHLALKAQNIRFSDVSRKTIKVTISIVVVFFITWAPFHITRIIQIYNGNELMRTLYVVTQTLAQINSCINPILYIFMGKDMKHMVRQSMQNIFRKNVLSLTRSSNQSTIEESVIIQSRA